MNFDVSIPLYTCSQIFGFPTCCVQICWWYVDQQFQSYCRHCLIHQSEAMRSWMAVHEVCGPMCAASTLRWKYNLKDRISKWKQVFFEVNLLMSIFKNMMKIIVVSSVLLGYLFGILRVICCLSSSKGLLCIS